MLAFIGLFLTLSLLGYDPADAPGVARWRAEPVPPANPCGPVGATLAHGLYSLLGWACWLVLYGLIVVTLLVSRRRFVPEKLQRAAGFVLVVLTVASVIQALLPGLKPSPVVGSGGYAGAFLVRFLGAQFGPVGLLLILAAMALCGLALCHELLLAWPVQEVLRLVRTLRSGTPAPMPHSPASPYLPATVAGLPALTRHHAELMEPMSARRAATHAPAAVPVERPALPPRGGEPTVPSLMPTARQAEARMPVPARPADGRFAVPTLELLDPPAASPVQEHEARLQSRALQLEKTLLEHGCNVRVVQIDTGPVITQFEIELEAGLRVSRVAGLSNDLAIALAVPSVRIVAPIPGKTTVGIEVPNERRGLVQLGEIIEATTDRLAKTRIPLFLGKDVKGQALAFDLADMPHLLIAGRTGTGKSVCLNAMILSILMTRSPDEVKLILIDPKMVELSQFKRIPHLMHPVITDMKKAESVLAWACEKMDERYAFLARAGVRNIQSYNALTPEEIYERLQPESEEEEQRIPLHMPYIVIIADEMADLMMTAAKEVEQHIVRLAQKSRAVGMHLIIATQKPTVEVITGLIKGNLPARIAFQVASRGDSRVVLDEMGADKLLGNGDMLFLVPGTSHIVRAQGTYVSDREVNRVCAYLEQFPVEFSKEMMQLQVGGKLGGKDGAAMKERDDLYESAIEVVIREQRGSTSLLQRALGIGYGRAARLIDFMAEDGIVGEFKSGSAREVLYSWDEWEALKNGGDGAGPGGD